MNKTILLTALLVVVVCGYFIYRYKTPDLLFPHLPSQSVNAGNYTGSDYKGNYVWGGAMNLAWNELSDNIVKDQIKFVSKDAAVQNLAAKFNSRFFTRNDLDDKSYYVKSGFGQETVDIINKESRAKFPSKSFSDLGMQLRPEDIIAYAYFLKEVEYLIQFEENPIEFNGELVDGFHSTNSDQNENIRIIKYWSDDKFIISLQLKDNGDQLIVAKGFDMDFPEFVITELNYYDLSKYEVMEDGDTFQMPKLHLDMSREYGELINQQLANKINGGRYHIAEMFENIKFDLDHKGARVENEAVIIVMMSSSPINVESKNLILDKPFWVVMKRADSSSPYFILGVNNTELMDLK